MIFFSLIFSISCIPEIGENEFNKLVLNGTGKMPIFIMFTGPNCKDCEINLMSFTDASLEMNDTAKFVVFDTSKNTRFTEQYELFDLPIFIMFFKFNQVPYDGPPTIRGFKTFTFECVKALSQQVDDSWRETDENRVILFSHRRILPEIFVNAYGRYHRRNIDFGMTNNKTFAKFFPGVKFSSYWFFKGKEKKMEYKGSIKDQDQFNKAIEKFFGIRSRTQKKQKEADYNEL
ncbi:hypothetical protein M9Y10_013312 [Tritrichomonas musculus]|uniref:Thioredoxin domain-containing protein n=1 Tax=Tritrichomonas musculus TaxID=1915356 RepID=A0ABR2I7I6_9EUKA